jgi:phage terminase large subunit-like protein
VSSSGSLPRSSSPRFAVPATDRPSYGDALAKTAELLKVPLMPWQELVAGVALEHDQDGQLAYRDVVVSTPRQSGKSTLVLALIVSRMLAAPEQTIVYGAQTRLAGRGKLFDKWWPRLRRSPLRDMFTLSRATGAEALRASNDSTLMLLSTDEGASHGETLDLAILDECWKLDPAAEQAVRPAMATRANGQLWALSTAGTEKSTFWRGKVDAGRTVAELGVTEGLAYFEWSAADTDDVTDPGTWPTFMPALGRTVSLRAISADLGTMPLPEWRRAYANQWPDVTFEGWKTISRDAWASARWT